MRVKQITRMIARQKTRMIVKQTPSMKAKHRIKIPINKLETQAQLVIEKENSSTPSNRWINYQM